MHRGPMPIMNVSSRLTYRKILRRNCLQASKCCTATAFSDIRSFSRLMLCSEFMRFVAAMDASAMAVFIESFSASRLNLRCLDFFLSLSFFFLSFEEET